ncbi:hypothetical protein ACFVH6_35400 [Spirillospora sp. NPDC127200]
MADKDPGTAPETPPERGKAAPGAGTEPGTVAQAGAAPPSGAGKASTSQETPVQETPMTGGTRTEPGEPAGTRRPPPARRLPGGGGGAAAARKRAVSLLAGLVSIVTTIVVLVLAVHIVFVVFEANASNDLVSRVGDWAGDLAWQFKDVFQPEDPKLAVAVNYGLAALVYLVIGRILVALIRRLG